MNIDRDNYEIYILDYYEGNLDAKTISELMHYLDQHPEAKEAFENYEAISLKEDVTLKFEDKINLKKNEIVSVGEINEGNYDDFCIESIENNLTADENDQLNTFFNKNPQLVSTFNAFKKTILKPDLSITFPAKEMLKKPVLISIKQDTVRRLILASVSVAAVLAVVFIAGIIISKYNSSTQNGVNFLASEKSIKSLRNPSVEKKQYSFASNSNLSAIDSDKSLKKNTTFAILDTSTKEISVDKLAKKKNYQIEYPENEMLASNNMSKRYEFSEVLSNEKLLNSRKSKDDIAIQNDNLTAQMVKGIKKAARTATDNKEDIKDNKHLDFWDVARFGVFAYNKITDNKLTLNRQTDADGRLKSFNLGDIIAYNRPEK
jgi:hypothetical protein